MAADRMPSETFEVTDAKVARRRRRHAWIRFASGALSRGGSDALQPKDAALMADRMLEEFDRRDFVKSE